MIRARGEDPVVIGKGLTQSILDSLRGAKLHFAPIERMGTIHPTSYRLQIQSGSHSVQLDWLATLAPEWLGLSVLVQTLEALGNEHAIEIS